MAKTIGILGGMGPLATANMYKRIVKLTDAATDNEHIRVFIDSNTNIADRTVAILEGAKSPLPDMLDSLKKLEQCGASCIIMPCNTAHYFLPELKKHTNIPFISIIETTANKCKELFSGKVAAILATKGTLRSGLYQKELERQGIEFLVPNDEEQDALMRVIYDGVKAGIDKDLYRKDMEFVINNMYKRGANFFILGCTEIPIAVEELNMNIAYIDPTIELAKAAILFCDKKIRG